MMKVCWKRTLDAERLFSVFFKVVEKSTGEIYFVRLRNISTSLTFSKHSTPKTAERPAQLSNWVIKFQMAFEQPRMNVSLIFDKLEKVWQQLTPPRPKVGP